MRSSLSLELQNVHNLAPEFMSLSCTLIKILNILQLAVNIVYVIIIITATYFLETTY
jgi:hypothetical protein